MTVVEEIFNAIGSGDFGLVRKYLLKNPETKCNEIKNDKGDTLFRWALACKKIQSATMIREALIKRKEIILPADEAAYDDLAIRDNRNNMMDDAMRKNNITEFKKWILKIPLSEKLYEIGCDGLFTAFYLAVHHGQQYGDSTITEAFLEAFKFRGEKCIFDKHNPMLGSFAIFQDLDTAPRSDTKFLQTILSMGYPVDEDYTLFSAINADAKAHAELLLKYKANPNQNPYGISCIELAIEKKNYYMAALLIRHGAYFSKEQLEILQSNYGVKQTQRAIDVAVLSVKKRDVILKSIIHFPDTVLSLMDDSLYAHLIKKLIVIIKSDKLRISKKTLGLLIDFLRSNEKLAFSLLSRIKVVAELWQMVTAPESVDQKQRDLCGPASFLSLLADSFPEKLIEAGLTLASTGKGISGSWLINSSKESRENEKSIMDALMIAIRYTAHPIIGYSDRSADCMQRIRGLTTPKALTTWFEQLGFEDITESMLIKGRRLGCGKTGEVSKMTQWMFSIYSDKHRSLQGANDLEELERKMGAGVKAIIMLYEKDHIHCAGFLVTHYVYLHALKIDPNKEKITLCYSTYGAKVEKECALKDFFKNYHGAIVGSIPTKKPA